MRHDNTVDLGVVQIHKKVIGDIAAASIKEVPGVQLATFGIIGSIAEAFGYKNYPSVTVTVDKDEGIRLPVDYSKMAKLKSPFRPETGYLFFHFFFLFHMMIYLKSVNPLNQNEDKISDICLNSQLLDCIYF